jgi:hypothetical protein
VDGATSRKEEDLMKSYLGLTAAVFALLTVIHVWRMVAESTSLARDPFFLLTTVLSAALCVWALRLLAAARRRTPPTS